MNKDFSLSLKHLDCAVKIRPNIALGYYNRAATRMKKGSLNNKEENRVIFDLLKAVILNPALRDFALKDDDFNKIRDFPCFRCLIRQEPVNLQERFGYSLESGTAP